jgi:hypothetical protein
MSHVRPRRRSAAARAREFDQTVARAARVSLERRMVRAAAMATTMAAGALAMVLTAPHAVADTNPLQPVIDDLLDSQQLMESDSSAWPWVTSADLPDVEQYTQTVAQTQLFFDLTGALGKAEGATLTQGFFSWNADAADPEGVLVLPNPDNQYYFTALDPNDTYTVTVDPGPGTQDMLFETISGNGLSTPFAEASSANLDTFTPNANGSYTITLSDTPQSGNWLDTAGADAMLLRGSMGDWGLPHDFMSIQQDGVATTNTLPLLSESEISTLLTQVAATDAAENLSATYYGQLEAPQTQLADNTFSPIQPTADFEPGPLLAGTTQISSFGNYDLQPDQALIVEVPNIDASYTGAELRIPTATPTTSSVAKIRVSRTGLMTTVLTTALSGCGSKAWTTLRALQYQSRPRSCPLTRSANICQLTPPPSRRRNMPPKRRNACSSGTTPKTRTPAFPGWI